jgi:hypothetical protein
MRRTLVSKDMIDAREDAARMELMLVAFQAREKLLQHASSRSFLAVP